MSSHLSRNLSYSINLPKATVLSEEVMVAVNKTLEKYYSETHYADYLNYYDLHKNLYLKDKSLTAMQSEKIILCEINACLWVKAFNSAINSITKYTYPHYIIVQKIINYVLNASSNENFGMVEEFFGKLLISHPPKANMYDYYWEIMSGNFVILSDKKTEERTLIFCLIEAITNCLKVKGNSHEAEDQTKESGLPYSSEENQSNLEVKLLSDMTNDFPKSPDRKTKKRQMFFVDLPVNEQLKRCLLLFNFAYNILETNFAFWLKSKELKFTSGDIQFLMFNLLWHNVRDIGLINANVNKILDFYKVVQSSKSSFQIKHLTKKFVTLLGESIRCSDSPEEKKYPFVGIKCDNFFRELSVILHQSIIEQNKWYKENELIINFKPPWLRLFLCCRLLSLVTGYQCLPELGGVYDILDHVAHSECRSQNVSKISEKPKNLMNSKLMAKLRRFKSINTKLRNGKTLLHEACEENDIEKIKALLTFPELDVNAFDREGWTALHVAAHIGHITSVQELLSFCPKSKDAQKAVNARARGPESCTPLMCAVSQGHAKICQLLLEHSGSVLLEDVNELNQTPLDLSNVPEVTNILQYYKKNNVWTLHSHKDINFDPELKEVVLKLCVEMIQAYFSTYRTWDVYKALKRSEKNSIKNFSLNTKWDYMRYHRDIKRNIYKLRKLIPKLERLEEYRSLSEVYLRILSFNKTC